MSHASRRIAQGMVAFMAGVCVGCAGTGRSDPPPGGPGTVGSQAPAPGAALERIALGRSTKADVSAALGEAIVIPFDSGYEVWVYRWPGPDRSPRSATELVLLFDPSGLATKARVRSGEAARR